MDREETDKELEQGQERKNGTRPGARRRDE